jgi:hypothetical protein
VVTSSEDSSPSLSPALKLSSSLSLLMRSSSSSSSLEGSALLARLDGGRGMSPGEQGRHDQVARNWSGLGVKNRFGDEWQQRTFTRSC